MYASASLATRRDATTRAKCSACSCNVNGGRGVVYCWSTMLIITYWTGVSRGEKVAEQATRFANLIRFKALLESCVYTRVVSFACIAYICTCIVNIAVRNINTPITLFTFLASRYNVVVD